MHAVGYFIEETIRECIKKQEENDKIEYISYCVVSVEGDKH